MVASTCWFRHSCSRSSKRLWLIQRFENESPRRMQRTSLSCSSSLALWWRIPQRIHRFVLEIQGTITFWLSQRQSRPPWLQVTRTFLISIQSSRSTRPSNFSTCFTIEGSHQLTSQALRLACSRIRASCSLS